MMKTLKNAEMLRVELRRGTQGEDDIDVRMVAVEEAPYWNDEDFEEWKSEVLTTINAQYNSYVYWTEIIVEWLFIDGHEIRYIELGRL
jgi:hypothetical protein